MLTTGTTPLIHTYLSHIAAHAVHNVLCNRQVEQLRLLRHQRHAAPVVLNLDACDVDAVNQDLRRHVTQQATSRTSHPNLPRVWLVELLQHGHNRRLARPARPHKRRLASGLDRERHIRQHTRIRPRRIREAHVLELDLGALSRDVSHTHNSHAPCQRWWAWPCRTHGSASVTSVNLWSHNGSVSDLGVLAVEQAEDVAGSLEGRRHVGHLRSVATPVNAHDRTTRQRHSTYACSAENMMVVMACHI